MTVLTEAQNSMPAAGAPEVRYEHVSGGVTRKLTVSGVVHEEVRSLPTPTGQNGSAYKGWWESYLYGSRRTFDRSAAPVRIVDLFSSVGGLSLGALEAIGSLGCRPVPLFAADVDARAVDVYNKNLRPRQIATDSVRDMVDFRVRGAGESAEFAYDPIIQDGFLGDLKDSVDLLLAGPPCQGHSSLNNHSRHADPKNLLYLTVPAIAVALNAKYVVIENVPNVTVDKRGVVGTTLALLKANGYQVSSGMLAADKLGWPQTRKRFFLVASREGGPFSLRDVVATNAVDAHPVSWLLDRHTVNSVDSTAQLPEDIMTSVPSFSRENSERVDWLFSHNEFNLPNEIRPDCHKDGTTYPSTYGRMFPDQPAPTITGGFLTPGRGRFIHPFEPRVLSPREAARIQGFPDWFDFSSGDGSAAFRADLSRWIGNAVPSILGYFATLSVLGGRDLGSLE